MVGVRQAVGRCRSSECRYSLTRHSCDARAPVCHPVAAAKPGFLITAVGLSRLRWRQRRRIQRDRRRAAPPLPFIDADRLVVIGERQPVPAANHTTVPRRLKRVVRDVRTGAADASIPLNRRRRRVHERREVAYAKRRSRTSPGRRLAECIHATRGRPIIGRGLVTDDDRLGVALATVLSHELWETQFGKDPVSSAWT